MGDRDGYNNPAFSNHLDLYDYQYVPEIDPDSPIINSRRPFLVTRQVPPGWDIPAKNINNKCTSSSDDSNGSIIIEERNNRRVTLICEKRPKVMIDEDGGYVHDISLESVGEEELQHSFPATISFSPPTSHFKYSKKENRKENKKQSRYYNDRDRYEVIDDEEYDNPFDRRHRYAEIDEHLQTEGVHLSRRKPRAPSPENKISSPIPSPFSAKFVPPSNFIRCNVPVPNFPNTSSPIDYNNSFEMSDFSPPRHEYSNQRQPPVGASSSHVPEPIHNLQHHIPSRKENMRSPFRSNSEKKVLLTPRNNIKIVKSVSKLSDKESGQKQSVRRNISASFDCSPKNASPYRTTTRALNKRSTAVITPILQRKFSELSSGNSFEKVSRMFQSTSNVKNMEDYRVDFDETRQNNLNIPPDQKGQMKRNKSVPNFHHCNEKSGGFERANGRLLDDNTMAGKSSPMKSPERFSPLSKSRLSLLDTMKSCHSYDDEEWTPMPSPCLLLASVVQLIAGITASVVCFYLLSKLGRKYYLDSGVVASFISIILGAVGFRFQKWKWLPNRNYVSGYVILSAFSVLNAAALIMIVSIRPMSGDPIMDICAGAICAISIIIILISITGLSMSACGNAPPPDNRVTSA